MKKNVTIRINLIISAIIIIGFIATAMVNYYTYSQVIKDDIENISKLTSTNIYSDINNELTKPIFVSLTMANDHFLKEWLSDEAQLSEDEAYIKKLQDYLIGIKMKYDYNSVFLVSDNTQNYYHYEGLHKSISAENEHDQWYYSFIDDDVYYELDVDDDEAADNKLTVFINCRIEDSEGSLMGVVGVGVEMDQVQGILKNFEANFDLEALLINPKGIIQVHADSQLIENINIFDESVISDFKEAILGERKALETFRFEEENLDGYLITRYIDELDWYLMVKKDTSILNQSFKSQLIGDLLIASMVVFLLVFTSTIFINRYKRQISDIAKTDQLTQLPNRRAFDECIESALDQFNRNKQIFNVFVLDIDGFKNVNDTYGHLFGDRVIAEMGNLVKAKLENLGMVARWGGDEFAGIIYGSLDGAKEITEDLVDYICNLNEFKKYGITISLGLTHVQFIDTSDSLMIRADRGLYDAKMKGKNRMDVV